MLGRKRKMRLAMMIAAGAATGGFGGAASRMLKSGGKKLTSSDALSGLSPQLEQLTGALKGDLANAGKAAAKAAINNRIESVAGSLHERTQSLLDASGEPAGQAEDEDEDRVAEDRDTEDRVAEDRDTEDRVTADRVPRQRAPRERPSGDRPRERRERPRERRPASAQRSGGAT